jgi:hypothetical protein
VRLLALRTRITAGVPLSVRLRLREQQRRGRWKGVRLASGGREGPGAKSRREPQRRWSQRFGLERRLLNVEGIKGVSEGSEPTTQGHARMRFRPDLIDSASGEHIRDEEDDDPASG